MIDSKTLAEVKEARNKLIDKIASSHIDSAVDNLMPLIIAVDDVTEAFEDQSDRASRTD